MGIIKAIPQIIAEIAKNIPKIIKSIVSGLSKGVGDVAKVGKNLVEGLWNGISFSLLSFLLHYHSLCVASIM